MDTPAAVAGSLLVEDSQVAGAPWWGSQLFAGGGTCSLPDGSNQLGAGSQLGVGSLHHKVEQHPGCVS